MPRTLGDDAKGIVGANLTDSRKSRGWSQTEAAERAQVRRDRLNRWEKGRELPGTEGLLRLAIAYGCPVDNFLGGVDERYDTVIERRIPVDAQQFYRTKLAKLKALTLVAMDLTAQAVGEAAPTPAAPVAPSRSSGGKAAPVRARQKKKR